MAKDTPAVTPAPEAESFLTMRPRTMRDFVVGPGMQDPNGEPDTTQAATEEDVDADETTARPDKKISKKVQGVDDVEQLKHLYSAMELKASRTASELGEMRNLMQQLLTQQATSPAAHAADHTYDDDPEAATDRKIANAVKPISQAVEKLDARAHQADFNARHPQWQAHASTPEFVEYVKSSPYRLGLFHKADSKDWGAADELFTGFEEYIAASAQASADEGETETQEQQVRKKHLGERGGSGGGAKSRKKMWKYDELVRMKMYEPDKYNAMQAEIMAAFAENRVKY